jgi:DNA-binding IclR family transcriptional regulator
MKRRPKPAPAEENPPDERYVVPGLKRGLELLDCFTHDEPEWTLSALALRLGVPFSSAFRLAHTLETMGFLVKGESGRYRLGLRLLSLGFEYLNSLEPVEIARPYLSALRESSGASAQLAVRDGRDIVYLIRISGRMRLKPDISVGTRLPAHAVTVGRILLSELAPRELEALYKGVEMDAVTAHTPTTVGQLAKLLEADRKRGYVFSKGGYIANVVSLATGIRDASGEIIAAISLSSTDSSIPAERWTGDLREALLGAAGKISAMLGYRETGALKPKRRW